MTVIKTYQKKPSFLFPKKVVASLPLVPGETVLDYGCGIGFWTMPLAKKVGSKGSVIAADVDIDRLAFLKRKAENSGISNIRTVTEKSLEGSSVTKQKLDMIFLSNILSEINAHENLLQELSANADHGTKLVVIEWNQESIMGPDYDKRLIEDTVIFIAAKAGFKFVKLLEVGTYHYGLIFEYTGEKFYARKK